MGNLALSRPLWPMAHYTVNSRTLCVMAEMTLSIKFTPQCLSAVLQSSSIGRLRFRHALSPILWLRFVIYGSGFVIHWSPRFKKTAEISRQHLLREKSIKQRSRVKRGNVSDNLNVNDARSWQRLWTDRRWVSDALERSSWWCETVQGSCLQLTVSFIVVRVR